MNQGDLSRSIAATMRMDTCGPRPCTVHLTADAGGVDEPPGTSVSSIRFTVDGRGLYPQALTTTRSRRQRSERQ